MRCTTLVSLAVAVAVAQSLAVPVSPNEEPSAITKRDLQGLIDSLRDGIELDDIKQSVLPDFLSWDYTTNEIQEKLGMGGIILDRLPMEFLNIP